MDSYILQPFWTHFLFLTFCVDSLGFSTYNIMSSVNKNLFVLSNMNAFYYISFSFLSELTSMMSNRSSESWHLCLVSDLRKAFSLPQLCVMLANHFYQRRPIILISTCIRIDYLSSQWNLHWISNLWERKFWKLLNIKPVHS